MTEISNEEEIKESKNAEKVEDLTGSEESKNSSSGVHKSTENDISYGTSSVLGSCFPEELDTVSQPQQNKSVQIRDFNDMLQVVGSWGR